MPPALRLRGAQGVFLFLVAAAGARGNAGAAGGDITGDATLGTVPTISGGAGGGTNPGAAGFAFQNRMLFSGGSGGGGQNGVAGAGGNGAWGCGGGGGGGGITGGAGGNGGNGLVIITTW